MNNIQKVLRRNQMMLSYITKTQEKLNTANEMITSQTKGLKQIREPYKKTKTIKDPISK